MKFDEYLNRKIKIIAEKHDIIFTAAKKSISLENILKNVVKHIRI